MSYCSPFYLLAAPGFAGLCGMSVPVAGVLVACGFLPQWDIWSCGRRGQRPEQTNPGHCAQLIVPHGLCSGDGHRALRLGGQKTESPLAWSASPCPSAACCCVTYTRQAEVRPEWFVTGSRKQDTEVWGDFGLRRGCSGRGNFILACSLVHSLPRAGERCEATHRPDHHLPPGLVVVSSY